MTTLTLISNIRLHEAELAHSNSGVVLCTLYISTLEKDPLTESEREEGEGVRWTPGGQSRDAEIGVYSRLLLSVTSITQHQHNTLIPSLSEQTSTFLLCTGFN